IPAGMSSGSVTFTVLNDSDVEGPETAVLSISAPTAGIALGATTSQSIAIEDDEARGVTLTVSGHEAAEGSAATITVTAPASAPVTGAQTVAVDVTGAGITASDYMLSSATITIPNGSLSGSVTFTVQDDAAIEGNEVAVLTLVNPSAGLVI